MRSAALEAMKLHGGMPLMIYRSVNDDDEDNATMVISEVTSLEVTDYTVHLDPNVHSSLQSTLTTVY
jgi:hypothetical protein